MANKKLFELQIGTPSNTDKIAYGKTGDNYYNITVADFKTFLLGENTHKIKTFEIGAWNMNTNASKSVPMILSEEGIIDQYIPQSKVRGVSVMIINDLGLAFCDFLSVQDGTPHLFPQLTLGGFFFSTNVSMVRRGGSYFDTSGYYIKTTNPDTTPYNRGWVTVTYEE